MPDKAEGLVTRGIFGFPEKLRCFRVGFPQVYLHDTDLCASTSTVYWRVATGVQKIA